MITTNTRNVWDTREFVPDTAGRTAWYLTSDGLPHRHTVVGWFLQYARAHNPEDHEFEPYHSERTVAAVERNGIAVAVDDFSIATGYAGFWYIADPGDDAPGEVEIQKRLVDIRPPLSGPPASLAAASRGTEGDLAVTTTETPTGIVFTDWEKAAVDAYQQTINGIPCTLHDDCLTEYVKNPISQDADEVGHLVRSYFGMLRTWYEALDTLYTGLHRHAHPPYDGPAFSTAGMEYLQRECTTWYRALHIVRRDACRFLFLDAGPQPRMDSGHLMFSDVVGIRLDGTVCAESN